MNILIVEDDLDKQNDIVATISEHFLGVSFEIASALTSGLQKLIFNKKIDLVILDMSMPSFEPSSDDPSGGTPESFAGLEFLEQMQLRGIAVPVVIVTQFVTFGRGSSLKKFDSLKEQIESDYCDLLKGMLHYSQSSGWESELISIIGGRE